MIWLNDYNQIELGLSLIQRLSAHRKYPDFRDIETARQTAYMAVLRPRGGGDALEASPRTPEAP